MPPFEIRAASADDFATAVDWAAAEGWNPGLGDLAPFHAADRSGFLMGYVDGAPVSSISVVRYGTDFGFLGFYIVHADHRGHGLGLRTWHAGMAHLDGRTVGLDGVVEQQDNYRKSGFVLAGRNIRHTGHTAPIDAPATCDIRPVTGDHLDAVAAFDARHFPASRAGFIRDWVLPAESDTGRRSVLAVVDGGITGLGTVRACRAGYKIGPLFADDDATARALFRTLTQTLPENAEVSLDTPEDNPAAVAIADEAGLQPVFETARMYRGTNPGLPLSNIFGVTTFELG